MLVSLLVVALSFLKYNYYRLLLASGARADVATNNKLTALHMLCKESPTSNILFLVSLLVLRVESKCV